MDIIAIKPLSVNHARVGRTYPSAELKAYHEILGYLLPSKKIPNGKLKVRLIFALSSKAADLDNNCKIFLDSLAAKYGFNDKQVYRIEMEKVDVKKGDEYIGFEITPI